MINNNFLIILLTLSIPQAHIVFGAPTNNFDNTDFVLMTKVFHALLDGFRDGIALGQDIDN